MTRLLPILIFVFLLLTPTHAYSAYRVYRLKVRYYDFKGKLERTARLLSTLDPYQYENYHSGYGRIQVGMIDTWFCPGDTSRKNVYCPKPKETVRGASYFPDKRSPFPGQSLPTFSSFPKRY